MKRNTKGFYTVEAAIFLPLVLLAVLSLGYFMRVEGTWENCINAAVDESMTGSRKAYDRVSGAAVGGNIEERAAQENENLDEFDVRGFRYLYSDGTNDALTSYWMEGSMSLELPLGFGREFPFEMKIKYRNFIGKRDGTTPLGDGLENDVDDEAVYIFPYSGERYHGKGCRYVSASVEKKSLTSALKRKYDSCGLCDSDELPAGSVVYCFSSSGSAYHRGSCKSIQKRTAVIGRSEAEKKGYTPCSKCGGG